MHKLIPHEVILVSSIPDCNFCESVGQKVPGPYDFATTVGGWAHGCKKHYMMYRASTKLGTGKGQLWVTEDQVDPVTQLKTVAMRSAAQSLRIAVENGQMDDEEFTREAKAIGLTEEQIERMFS